MISEDVLGMVEDHFTIKTLLGEARDIGSFVLRNIDRDRTVKILRGRMMREQRGVFDECAAALQFPLYFGENWDAFFECLDDLDYLPPRAGYVLVITQPHEVLRRGEAAAPDLDSFIHALQRAHDAWAEPVARGVWWDRPAVPFHVVLAGKERSVKEASAVWSAHGCDVVEVRPDGDPSPPSAVTS